MLRASRALRLWSIGWALLQLLLPPLASLVEGATERAEAPARLAHVEALGERDCPPVHAADCAVCRQLGGNGVPATVRVPVPEALVHGEVRGGVVAAPARHPDDASRPRAPPATA